MESNDGLTPRERAALAANADVEMTTPSEQLDHSEIKPEDTTDAQQLTGVGGWLLVLIVLLVLGCLRRVATHFSDIDLMEMENIGLAGSAEWQAFKAKALYVVLADLAVSALAAVLLIYRRVPSTIPVVIACLWFLGPVRLILMLWISEEPGSLLGYVLPSLVIPMIWTAYLLRSRRVQLTYSGDIQSV